MMTLPTSSRFHLHSTLSWLVIVLTPIIETQVNENHCEFCHINVKERMLQQTVQCITGHVKWYTTTQNDKFLLQQEH